MNVPMSYNVRMNGCNLLVNDVSFNIHMVCSCARILEFNTAPNEGRGVVNTHNAVKVSGQLKSSSSHSTSNIKSSRQNTFLCGESNSVHYLRIFIHSILEELLAEAIPDIATFVATIMIMNVICYLLVFSAQFHTPPVEIESLFWCICEGHVLFRRCILECHVNVGFLFSFILIGRTLRKEEIYHN